MRIRKIVKVVAVGKDAADAFDAVLGGWFTGLPEPLTVDETKEGVKLFTFRLAVDCLGEYKGEDFPPAETVSIQEPSPPCPKCQGCGQVANTPNQEPWSEWLGLSLTVMGGIVKPIPCPMCRGAHA